MNTDCYSHTELLKDFCKRYRYDIKRLDSIVIDKKFTQRLSGYFGWKALRQDIFKRFYGLDVLRFVRDIETDDAYSLHHIIPVKDNPLLMFDERNLIPLSNSMHAKVHIAYTLSAYQKENMQKQLKSALCNFFYGQNPLYEPVIETSRCRFDFSRTIQREGATA